jgi:hypothetical protein
MSQQLSKEEKKSSQAHINQSISIPNLIDKAEGSSDKAITKRTYSLIVRYLESGIFPSNNSLNAIQKKWLFNQLLQSKKDCLLIDELLANGITFPDSYKKSFELFINDCENRSYSVGLRASIGEKKTEQSDLLSRLRSLQDQIFKYPSTEAQDPRDPRYLQKLIAFIYILRIYPDWLFDKNKSNNEIFLHVVLDFLGSQKNYLDDRYIMFLCKTPNLNINIADSFGHSSFRRALSKGDCKLANWLLRYGIKPDSTELSICLDKCNELYGHILPSIRDYLIKNRPRMSDNEDEDYEWAEDELHTDRQTLWNYEYLYGKMKKIIDGESYLEQERSIPPTSKYNSGKVEVKEKKSSIFSQKVLPQIWVNIIGPMLEPKDLHHLSLTESFFYHSYKTSMTHRNFKALIDPSNAKNFPIQFAGEKIIPLLESGYLPSRSTSRGELAFVMISLLVYDRPGLLKKFVEQLNLKESYQDILKILKLKDPITWSKRKREIEDVGGPKEDNESESSMVMFK